MLRAASRYSSRASGIPFVVAVVVTVILKGIHRKEVVKMITIKSVQESGVCVFCKRAKEVVVVQADEDIHSNILVCWDDLRKLAHMKMRTQQPQPRPMAK